MEKLLNYKSDIRVSAAVLAVVSLALVVYITYFDILIPNVGSSDSYRDAVGGLFVIPVILLALGQTVVGGVFVHALVRALNLKKSDFIRSLLVSSMMTFALAFTYFLFPKYGPFYFIVFVYDSAPWYALPLELTWALSSIAVVTYSIKRLFSLPYRYSLLVTVLVGIFIVVAAS